MRKLFAAALGAAMLIVAGASANDAAPLSDEKIRKFMATMPAVQALAGDLEASGKDKAFEIDAMPKAGEPFRPYGKSVEALKARHPDEHARLGAAVRPQGFTADSWAAVGDRVVLAYAAEKAAKENPVMLAQMQAMDPAMLAMVPPEMRAQMETAMAMMEAVKAAPAADRAAVRPHLAALDAMFDGEDGS